MLRRRIAGTVCSVAFSALAVAGFPGVSPAATSPAPSSPASADPGGYPAQGPLLTVTSGTVEVGGSVTVSGRGFQSGEVVDLVVTYGPANHALGSGGPVAQSAAFTLRHGVAHATAHAVATPAGDFSAQVQLTQAGNATITATGEESHLSGAANVSVLAARTVAATKSTKHSLPISEMELLILGLVVVVAALIAAEVVRKRSRMPSAAQDVFTA
jgi:hypothetical protein